MNELAANRNIGFLVVLIPTKELVFSELWGNSSMIFRTLTENEEQIWKITKEFFNQTGIQYIDALPALREKLAAGNQPYQVTHDGHPNEHGHMAIAERVAEYLETHAQQNQISYLNKNRK